MDLVNLIKKYQGKFDNDSMLIDSKLFLNGIINGQCKFVIDENENVIEYYKFKENKNMDNMKSLYWD